MILKRVKYGKKDTPVELREYQINGLGPVGTLKEFQNYFPSCNFKIIDETELDFLIKILRLCIENEKKSVLALKYKRIIQNDEEGSIITSDARYN